MRARHWLLVAEAVAGLLALLLWLRHEAPATPPSEQAAAPLALPMPMPAPASVPASAPVARLSAYLRHYDPAMEVCLRPPMSTEAAAALASPGSPMARYMEQQTEDLREHVLRQLDAGDDRAKVAAMMLRGDVAGAADIARRSEDGEAYGMAWQVCQGRTAAFYMRHAASAADATALKALAEQAQASSEPKCEALSLRRWAQLRPGDAAPWLQLLDEARRTGDAAGANEALYRAGLATQLQSRWPWLAGQVYAALPEDAPEGGRLMLLSDAIGRDAALIASDTMAAMKTCEGAALLDANRRQDCGQLARLLRERSDRAIDRRVGSRIGERLGLPPAKPDFAVLSATMARRAASDAEAMEMARDACSAMRVMARQAMDVARLGEWARLTADEGSGKP